MRQDCLLDVLEDLQRQRPPVFLCDEWHRWVAQIGQAIAALPTRDQRQDAIKRIGDEMVAPGMPVQSAYQVIIEAVLREGKL